MVARKQEPTLDPNKLDNKDPGYQKVKQRFSVLNKLRLQRTYDDLRPQQRRFLELLPLFYHVNHPILPGYVSKATPSGIPNYSVAKQVVNSSHQMFKSFEYKRRAYRKFDISAIYLMGSTGSIAYSAQSDFDIWVCYESKLDKKQLDELKRKTMLIEEWAKTQGIQTSIFLVNPEKLRRGELDELSQESSGTALHYLLLDEFYRTSLLLAGRYPTWWLIHPDEESAYEQHVSNFQSQRFLHAKEHLDFGGLNEIPAGEFYGATIWALYKSIHAPYKSMLKILLMQAYAHSYPDIELLGLKYKRAVYASLYDNDIDLDAFDPYIMMFNHAEEFLLRTNQDERLDLLRRSFYFKVNQRLTVNNTHRKDNWRAEIMLNLTRSWNWTHGFLEMLDARDTWKVNRVQRERVQLIDEFTRSYNFLSDFTSLASNDQTHISADDLHLLGRKLYAAFERKAGKIETIYQGITEDLYESHVSIHYAINLEGESTWMVFNNIVEENTTNNHTPIKRSYDLIELVAWCFFNKIISKHTVIAVHAPDSDLSETEIKSIIRTMEKLFPDNCTQLATTQDYMAQSSIRNVGTFINMGVDPFASHSKRGTQLTSMRTDALRYGGLWENLALSFAQVIVTSWQEVLTFHYSGVKGLMNCLRDYIQWSPPSSGKRPPRINAYSYSSYRGPTIARRIENLFEGIINFFYSSDQHTAKRFILGVEWDYYVLQVENDHLHFFQAGTLERLNSYLSQSQAEYIDTAFDTEADRDVDLVLIYALNRPDIVQCFYRKHGNSLHLYVLDEHGSLDYREIEYYDPHTLVEHLHNFILSAQRRIDLISPSRLKNSPQLQVQFYQIITLRDNRRQIEQYLLNQNAVNKEFISVQASCDVIDENTVVTLFCNGHEYSTLEYGKNLYHATAKAILNLRNSHEYYPIYITDIELSRSLLGDDVNHAQTFHYLNYKQRIEQQLNEAVKKLQV